MGGKVKAAVVGAGMIANAAHIPAWQHLAEVDVVGVYNRHVARANDTARRHGIAHAYDDFSRMLEEQQPDIVSVCTPNMSHKAMTVQALQAGAHVLCEKPVAASYADAVEMYAAARKANRHLFACQTGRFRGEATAARALAVAGELGDVYYAETAALRRRGVPMWGRFHMRAHSGGGPLYDIGVHALDLLLWIMGNPRVVRASGATYTKVANRGEQVATALVDSGAPVGVHDPRHYDPGEFDVEDLGAGLLRLENGGTISIRVSWAANVVDGTGETFLLGTTGGLYLHPLRLIRNLAGYQVTVTPKVPAEPDIPFYGHWRLVEHVLAVLRGEEEPLVKESEVRNVIGALEGLYRSAELGCEVAIG
jgi:predicted dehydrogenase